MNLNEPSYKDGTGADRVTESTIWRKRDLQNEKVPPRYDPIAISP